MNVLNVGDKFLVYLVSQDEHPQSYGIPYFKINPDGVKEPAPNLIWRGVKDIDDNLFKIPSLAPIFESLSIPIP